VSFIHLIIEGAWVERVLRVDIRLTARFARVARFPLSFALPSKWKSLDRVSLKVGGAPVGLPAQA
jgi:hypothetical protein